jgi:hypothetical protein
MEKPRFFWWIPTQTKTLGEMIGVDLHEHGKKTISDLLIETFLEQGGTLVGAHKEYWKKPDTPKQLIHNMH